jgi:hypothetical protein
MTPSFFVELYQKFHEEWPLTSPNAKEISKADANKEKAKTLKQKASEQVSGSLYHDILNCILTLHIPATPRIYLQQSRELLYFSHDFAKQENTTYLILALKLP